MAYLIIGIVVVAIVAFFLMRKKDDAGALPPERPATEGRREEKKAEPAKKKAEPAKAEEAPKKKEAAPKKELPAEPKAEAAKAAEEEAPEEEAPEEEAPEEEAPEEEAPEEDAAAPHVRPEPAPPRASSADDVKRLKKGLKNTRGGFIARLASVFGGKKEIDPGLLDEIEEVLITADIGVKTTTRILDDLRDQLAKKELSDADKVWDALRRHATEILETGAGRISARQTPTVVLVVGVNGVGKTTTIGKMASAFASDGKKVLLAAGDTFRAAAVLQLEVWGRRVKCPVVKGKDRADPASVIFEAVKQGVDEGYDVVICDTAGRLHTKSNLMEELKKVGRSLEKALGRPADEVLLVLDATTGQNAIQQAALFKETLDITGIALTKLDGSAKGGVILGIVDEHQVPVRYVGIGEKVEDLREFEASGFVEALFEKPSEDSGTA